MSVGSMDAGTLGLIIICCSLLCCCSLYTVGLYCFCVQRPRGYAALATKQSAGAHNDEEDPATKKEASPSK